jgi:hypothetical protein
MALWRPICWRGNRDIANTANLVCNLQLFRAAGGLRRVLYLKSLPLRFGEGLVIRHLADETGLPVCVADDPLCSVVLGTAKLLDDFRLLRRVAAD